MAPQLGKVFISSVFGGMLDLRALAARSAELLGFSAVLTERQIAQAGAVADALTREIEACDTYIGLFDRRRGTVPKEGTKDHRAITEEELRIARERGLRCLVFLSRAKGDKRDPELTVFLEREVTDYTSGVWTRPYTRQSLKREIVAALAVLRPRIVLALEAGEARLYLGGVQPAWAGDTVLGPVPVDLSLSPGTQDVLRDFLAGLTSRNRPSEDQLRIAGDELAARALPASFLEALEQILAMAAMANVLVTLEIRTEDATALALPWELLSLPGHPLPVKHGLLEIVRRIPRPGESLDPSRDPAPEVPPDHLSILGFTAAPLEDQAEVAQLGAGGFADSDLFWEREQERLLEALDDLLRERRGRLILPDTGEKEVLRAQLTRKDRPRVVHLSCHGGVSGKDNPEPVLYLEDQDGYRAPLTGSDLFSWVRAAAPGAQPVELLVLSACGTANEKAAPGLAENLVRNGLPRVLGMQGPVSDSGATSFAGAFYSALGKGADLPLALRAGRVELAVHGEPHEWAVPSLTLSQFAGPLASPEGTTPRVKEPFEEVEESFRIENVTYLKKGYVGRREMERRLRRAMERGRVVVIHGLGGIGKSTLAARFLARRQDEGARLIILYAGRELSPALLLEEVARKVGIERPIGPAEVAEELFRKSLSEELRKKPTYLLLDNFEDNQAQDGSFKNPELARALVDLAILGGSGFRILLTSRQAVQLPPGPIAAVNLDLGELSNSGCRKMRALDPEGLGRLERSAWRQVLLHLGGHPKALEILSGYLHSHPDQKILQRLGPAVQHIDQGLAEKQQERGRSLLVDVVLEEVPEEKRPAFDRLCLLEIPLLPEELEQLLSAEGLPDPTSNLAWLRGQGLLARKAADSALSGGDAVHRILASRQQRALADREGEEAARVWHFRVADHLKHGRPLSNLGVAARHRYAGGDLAEARWLYNQWALALRNKYAYAACLEVAREGIEAFPLGDSERERAGVASLWISIHDGLLPLGNVYAAREALAIALDSLKGSDGPDVYFCRATIRWKEGRLLILTGKTQEATEKFEESLANLARGDYKREKAILIGDIARLRAQAGDITGALKLYEEELAVYDQLEDVRSRTVTLGYIARLRAQTGDVAGALKLQEEILTIFDQLKDVGARAVALGDIARSREQTGDISGALKLYEEILEVWDQLGSVQERAVTLGDIARLRARTGDISRALKLDMERLEITRILGDVDGIAATQLDLAQFDLSQGRAKEARDRLSEAWDIFLRIGRADGIAITGLLYGMLLAAADSSKAKTILQAAREKAQLLEREDLISQLDEILKSLEGGSANPE
jgi:tetratricopeptide (TPR) repeat protein